jgi:hypothetical protein
MGKVNDSEFPTNSEKNSKLKILKKFGVDELEEKGDCPERYPKFLLGLSMI